MCTTARWRDLPAGRSPAPAAHDPSGGTRSAPGYGVRVSPRRPRPAPLRALAALGVAAALGASAAACTPAPSGRLDTAPAADLPSVRPAGPPPVTDLPTFDARTAVGEHAPGFPADLLPTPPDATVLASSAQPGDDGLTTVSLSLTSPHPTADVLAQLGGPLAAAGFAETAPQASSALTAQTAWTRRTPEGDGVTVETLLIGVLDDGELRHVSVSGTVQVPPG